MKHKISTRRKFAIASWQTPKEGNMYGKQTINATNMIKYIKHLRNITKEKVTVTHLIGKAIGLTLENIKTFNNRILFNKYIPHKTIDISFLVALNHGQDLTKIKICNINNKKCNEIAQELQDFSKVLREKKSISLKKNKRFLQNLPNWLLKPIIWICGYFTGILGFNFKELGLESFPFGSCIITSVGMLDIYEGYAPLMPFARVPLLIVITKIKDEVIVLNGKIKIEPQLKLMATIDHRFIDGQESSSLSTKIKKQLEKPWKLDNYSKCPW